MIKTTWVAFLPEKQSHHTVGGQNPTSRGVIVYPTVRLLGFFISHLLQDFVHRIDGQYQTLAPRVAQQHRVVGFVTFHRAGKGPKSDFVCY